MILVFNKIDLFDKEEPRVLEDWEEPVIVRNQSTETEIVVALLKNSYLDSTRPKTVFISAEQKENIEDLREALIDLVREKHIQIFPNWLAGSKQ